MAASTPSKAIPGTLCARTATPLGTMRFTGTEYRPINSLKKEAQPHMAAGYIQIYLGGVETHGSCHLHDGGGNRNLMRWAGLINTLKAQVEEVMLQEFVFI